MTDDFIYKDLNGKKIKPSDLKKANYFYVTERKGCKLGKFSIRDWERKIR